MATPSSDIDLYAPESLLNPYENYRKLRDLGSAVWMDAIGGYAVARYDDVRAALEDGETFTSTQGVTMNEDLNHAMRGTTIASNGERHTALRKVIEAPLTPPALAPLRASIEAEAEALVERLVAKGRFDAATELAEHLPVTIVSNLVGLPEDGRERMLDWSRAQGDIVAPACPRTAPSFPVAMEMFNYQTSHCVPGILKPDGWADRIWQAADRGDISHDDPPQMMNDYIGPSLDTTIAATGSLIWLFTQFPQEWSRLRAQPSLIPQAVNEAVRMETPIQGFSRKLTRDVEMGGVQLPAGARTLLLYGSANRDERHWDQPDHFDIGREGLSEHVGFGRGEHRCPGMNLARLEIMSLLKSLLKRVERFELVDCERAVNSGFRIMDRCVVQVR